MPFDPEYTANWYDTLGLGEWERWERSAGSQMEFHVTLHHLRQLVQRGDRVLDAGCGAGRFTCELLAWGAEVVALDLSPEQLELCRQRAPGARDYMQASITDLRCLDSGSFDVVLALGGPMSYCFDQAGVALRELMRVAKPGARLMLSVMNQLGSLHQFLPGVLQGDASENEHVLRSGDLSRAANGGHECKLYRLDELRALLKSAGLEDLDIQAPGWLTSVHHLELPSKGSAQWRFLLEAELAASRESPAAGSHLVAMARTPAG